MKRPPRLASVASRRAVQSQSPHAHGSVAVQVAAAAARVGVLHLLEIEVVLPVRALFGQRRRAVADFDPLHAPVLVDARLVHVAEVLVAGHRAGAERAVVDRPASASARPGLTVAVTR